MLAAGFLALGDLPERLLKQAAAAIGQGTSPTQGEDRRRTHEVSTIAGTADAILTGFPSFGRFEFLNLNDDRPVRAILELELEVFALSTTRASFKTSVNGSQRHDLVLRPGKQIETVQIPLSENDFTGDRIFVTFNLVGEDTEQVCKEITLGASVRVRAESRIFVVTNRTSLSSEDRARASGGSVKLSWGANEESPAAVATSALAAAKAGYAVSFVGEEEMSHTPEEVLAFRHRLNREKIRALPIPMRSVRSRPFARSYSFRETWKIGDFLDRQLPTEVRIDLELGQNLPFKSDIADTWRVTIRLNDRLLLSEIHPPGRLVLERSLPIDLQGVQNTLEIHVETPSSGNGICGTAPSSWVDLSPASFLSGGKLLPRDPFAFLGPDQSVRLYTENLDRVPGSTMTRALELFASLGLSLAEEPGTPLLIIPETMDLHDLDPLDLVVARMETDVVVLSRDEAMAEGAFPVFLLRQM